MRILYLFSEAKCEPSELDSDSDDDCISDDEFPATLPDRPTGRSILQLASLCPLSVSQT